MSNLHPRTIRTRSTLLDAAWTLIAERGLTVRMADIADAVGMSRQSLYVHFKTRGGLLVALVRRADEREGIHEGFSAALSIDEPEARLARFLEIWFDFVPKIHPVAKQLIAARAHDAEADAAWSDRMSELRDGYLRLTRSIRRDGALSTNWTAPQAADYLWAGTSVQHWESLSIDCGWGPRRTAKILQRNLAAVVLD